MAYTVQTDGTPYDRNSTEKALDGSEEDGNGGNGLREGSGNGLAATTTWGDVSDKLRGGGGASGDGEEVAMTTLDVAATCCFNGRVDLWRLYRQHDEAVYTHWATYF